MTLAKDKQFVKSSSKGAKTPPVSTDTTKGGGMGTYKRDVLRMMTVLGRPPRTNEVEYAFRQIKNVQKLKNSNIIRQLGMHPKTVRVINGMYAAATKHLRDAWKIAREYEQGGDPATEEEYSWATGMWLKYASAIERARNTIKEVFNMLKYESRNKSKSTQKGTSPHIAIVRNIRRGAGFQTVVRGGNRNKIIVFLKRPISTMEVMRVIDREELPIDRGDVRSTAGGRRVIVDLRDSAKAAFDKPPSEIKRERDARAFDIKRQREAEREWVWILKELAQYWKWAKTTSRFDERTQGDYEQSIVTKIRGIGITGPRNGIQQDFGQLDILGETFDSDPEVRDRTRRQILNRLKNMLRKAKASRKFHRDKWKKLERAGKSASRSAKGGGVKAIDAKLINMLRQITRDIQDAVSKKPSTSAPTKIGRRAKRAKSLVPQGHLYNGLHEAINEVIRFADGARNAGLGKYEQLLNHAMRSARSALEVALLLRKQPHPWDSGKTKKLVADLKKLERQAYSYARVAPRNTNKNNVKLFGGLMRNWKKLLVRYPELTNATRNSTVPQMMKPGTFIRGGKGDPKGYFLAIGDGLKYLALMAPKFIKSR